MPPAACMLSSLCVSICSRFADLPASFAAEIIAAYPEAKVILNTRRDLDAWHRSAINNLGLVSESWVVYLTSWFTTYGYWSWSLWERYLWLLLFRSYDGDLGSAIRKNGKWIYKEHENMIRGLVPKERLLEWSVDDGWEPLCKVCNMSHHVHVYFISSTLTTYIVPGQACTG